MEEGTAVSAENRQVQKTQIFYSYSLGLISREPRQTNSNGVKCFFHINKTRLRVLGQTAWVVRKKIDFWKVQPTAKVAPYL